MSLEQELLSRSQASCELCGSNNELIVYPVEPSDSSVDQSIMICSICKEQIEDDSKIDVNHWHCLNDTIWSNTAAIQVMSYRVLQKIAKVQWAQNLLDILYLEPEIQRWADYFNNIEILNTKRLMLRTINYYDFEVLHKKIFSDFEVVKNTFGSSMFSQEDTYKFLKENGNFNSKIGLSTLIEKETNTIIGLAGILPCEYLNTSDYEIGFILEKQSWGKGYAKEIGLAQIELIKDVFNHNRALAVVAPDNLASIKSLESLDFKLEKQIEIPRGNRLVYSLTFKSDK